MPQADPLKLPWARALAQIGDAPSQELVERTGAAGCLLLCDHGQAEHRVALGGLVGGLEEVDLAGEVVVHAAAADASASEDLLRGDLLEVSFEEQIAHRADQPLASSAGRATTPGGRRCCCRFGWGIDTGQSLRYFTNRQSVGKTIGPTGLSTDDTK